MYIRQAHRSFSQFLETNKGSFEKFSHSLLVARERFTMHLSWILIVFQIISTQIYGKQTPNYRANNLTPSTIPHYYQDYYTYETENDTVSTYYCINKELFNTLKDQK